MRHSAYLLACLLLTSASACEVPQPFLGTWRSDAELTLAEMRSSAVPEEFRSALEDGIFGRLVVIFRQNDATAYFPDIGEPNFESYDSHCEELIINGQCMTFISMNSVTRRTGAKEWCIEAELLYTETTKWKFKEFFRRVGD